ncbi:hypothetical protein G7Y89_g8750 [Cudoniella acicularis]|uniref:Polyketide synthase n=1 Tax=Cudoniella acicularis TaxID=354080 RepID=A0A8H4RHL9_9HELO|nr:hypothetical protein G7Y89_g8750 [Cudoniella acicularis]
MDKLNPPDRVGMVAVDAVTFYVRQEATDIAAIDAATRLLKERRSTATFHDLVPHIHCHFRCTITAAIIAINIAMSASRQEDIAIIGSGCRFPGYANSPSKLWDLVRNPRQVAEPIPIDRLGGPGFYHEKGQYHGHMNVKEAYFLAGEGVHRRFDAPFFGMNAAEANALDPQCRLLLETVFEALEEAGLTIEGLRGSDTAMYAGQMVGDYDIITTRDSDGSEGIYNGTGTSRAMLSNRISYFFDWHGPSMTIDTACSSSLVALHQAVQQLRLGHSRVAVATGANMLLDPSIFIKLSSLRMLSPEGRCRMWDVDANGYARGEGIAAVVLKTLSAALEDGDEIECIVRETGFAQDGRTQGITMPNPAAQAHLIRDCYARAGLNLTNPAHRPQFFECHGTGTQAGDAAEAEAISSAFGYGPENSASGSDRLWVGSIKSVIGHTEGTAGLAGILKASLALQSATIPPNLGFNRLNPRIQPFYTNLQVSTTAAPWPAVLHNGPRRASVNSFGFGGANVHAILESYMPAELASSPSTQTTPSLTVFTPFVFSASSETSLAAYLAAFLDYVRANADKICLQNLAYTLHTRRTCLQVTTTIVAGTVDELCTKLEVKLQAAQRDSDAKLQAAQKDADGLQPAFVRVRVPASRYESSGSGKSKPKPKPRILGIFTGQGAQWAGMGSDLITHSTAARNVLQRLETRLSQLPAADRPSWSLIQELQKESSSSRIREATLSQPLCTAIQILQVDLLRAAGVEFAAVVGHSSGEIAAAYAAGFISAEEAICISYYRGLHSKLALALDGKPGVMMAVGTSTEDAQELCDTPEFEGRVCIAAVNSSASLTLSGDQDAIEEIKVIFDDEGKFTRILRVDKAYHSHHMSPCSTPYLKSLAACGVQVGLGSRSTWFSSVFRGEDMSGKHKLLKDTYWDRNMARPVLFQQAIEGAYISKGPFDLVIEVGPHPALKGPVLQTTQEVSGQELLYTGLFHRGISAVESVADGLGYIWTRLGPDAVHLHNYDRFLSPDSPCKLVKGLPTYAWDHQNEYWNESRSARAFRMRPDPVHELLGHLTPDSNEWDMRWRHILRPTEIPWLVGHRLQDQIVFPAAGYVVTALEAAMAWCKQSRVSASLIELVDLDFGRALVFNHDESSVEIIVCITDILLQGSGAMEAKFKYFAADGKGDDSSLVLMAYGRLLIFLGDPCTDVLPTRLPKPPNLVKVREDDFYERSRDLEYQWTGSFAALEKLERKLGTATGFIKTPEPSGLLLHPAIIDAAFQSVLLAYSFPGDGQLWTIHVPRRIQRLSVNPFLCAREIAKEKPLPFDSSHHPDTETIFGHTDVYPNNNLNNAIIQIQGIECAPLSRADARDDKEAFATMVWDVASPDAQSIAYDSPVTPEQYELARHLERMAGFYLRALQRDIPTDHPSRIEGPYTHLLQFASQAISFARAGCISSWCSAWEHDTYEQLILACKPFAHTVDMQFLRVVGETMTDIVKGDMPATEVGIKDNMLSHFYTNSLGPRFHNIYLAQAVKQLTHRYPQMDILEIGARTGATTEVIFDEIGSTFSSYTLTDVSPDFLDSAKSWAEPHLYKMIFKTLDIDQDPVPQGFLDQSYDLVVASLILHTTPVLEQTLRNARRLLKPGGHLIVFELLPTKSAVYGVIFGAFPGWWRGVDEGRVLSPALSLIEWDALLRKTGFSGCDTTTPELTEQNCITHFTVFVSQAMDDKITFLRHPLSSTSSDLFSPGTLVQDLVILGGNSLETTRLAEQTKNLLHRYCGNIRVARTLSDLSCADISNPTVLSFVDLDEPVFQHLNHTRWESLKEMLMTAGTLVWVTRGRRADNPWANIIVGLMRSIVREAPNLSYQILDIEDARNIDAYTLAGALLRFQAEVLWRRQDSIFTTVETELVLDKEGRLIIPRLVTSKEMNDRYNSSKRTVVARVHPHAQNVCVGPSDTMSGYELKQESVPSIQNEPGAVRMEISHSVLSAVRVAEFGYMFVILGKDSVSQNQLVALSTKHSFIAYPLESLCVRVEAQPCSEASLLSLIAYNLLAFVTLRGLSKGDIILVHEPDPGFAAILSREARCMGVHVTFVTTSQMVPRGSNWLKIHHAAPDRVLSRLLPAKISVFVDFASQTGSESIGDRIRSQLPAHCRRETLETFFNTTACVPLGSYVHEIYEHLHEAVARASCALAETNEMGYAMPPIIPAESLAGVESEPALSSVIDWTGNSDIPVVVRPIDTQITFSDQRTYWLAGLSGSLGLSLCEWMFRHGAKFFVISSRRPTVDASWLKGMRELGAVVKISACDITTREDVVALHAEICEAMPLIGGVAQGAMVMSDASIEDMTLDTLWESTKPKVDGSIHLNDLFQENTLDFFVFFSSVVSVIGRPGQANYSAANMFMCSLAEQRRQRGLAASIIHIGPISGVGYIVQQEKLLFDKIRLRSSALVPISERDFYQLFAEAVIAGRSGSVRGTIELLNGVRTVSRHDHDQPVWEAEPLMNHFIRNPEGLAPVMADSQSRVPLRTQLTHARNQIQIYNIIQDALFPKICTMFQLDSNKLAKETLAGMRLNEMGIDSLLAVEIRGWFMKTLEVNIPVLKIFSGIPIADLINIATEAIPERLVPNLEHNCVAETGVSVSDISILQETVHDPGTGSSLTIDSSDSTQISSIMSELDSVDETPLVAKPPGTIIQKSFRLSFSQEMFWFVWAFLKDKTSLNHTIWARLTGEMRTTDFQRAIRSLGQRHRALRTCIIEQDGKPMQGIMESSSLDLEIRQIEEEEEVHRTVKLLQHHHVYDVARGQTMRVILLSRSPTEHFLVAGVHPLVADGLSMQSLLKEVRHLYIHPKNDQTHETRQFSNYSEKQHSDFEAGKFEAELQFWRAEFATATPPLPILTLSKATSRPTLTAYENERAALSISAETKEQIQAICRRHRATPFHFYLATFRVLLLRYSPVGNGEDIAIGIGDANRTEDEMMDVVGPFVNLLPLRLRTQASAKFTQLLQDTRDRAYAALAHSKVPFQVLLNDQKFESSDQVEVISMLASILMQGLRETTQWGNDLTLHSVEVGIPKMAYDITLEMVDYAGGECLQTLLVRKDLYSQSEAQRLAKSYERLIKAFVADPALLLDQPNLFEPAEIQEVIKFSRGPSWPSQWPETVIHQIDQITQTRLHDVAVRYGNVTATYAEISAHANNIAAALQTAHIAPGSPVAVLQEPHPAWISSLLAIMRVGAVYLPLDLGLPWARLASIIQDCQPPVVLVDENREQDVSKLQRPEMRVIDVSRVGQELEREAIAIPIYGAVTGDALAAILYTSGSSGVPKGILLKHQGLCNWTEPIARLYNLGAAEVVLQQTSPTFDLSLVQIFSALCFGGSLVLIPRQQRGDAQAICKIITSEGITFTGATPSECL